MHNNTNSGWKGLVIPVGVLFLWFFLGVSGRLNTQVFPTCGEVWEAFRYLSQKGLLWHHVANSLSRVFAGFGLAILVGVPLGLLMGCVPQSHLWFGPTLHFLRQIPPTAWIPVFLLWFGIGEGPKFAVIFYAAVFPITINSALGVQQIPKEYWEVSRALCLPPLKILTTLVIPGSYHAVFTGLRLGMGMSWRAIVAAEMLASTSGLGYLVMSSRSLARVDEMFAGIAFIGFIGVLIDMAFVTVQNHLIPSWRWRVSKAGGEDFVSAPTPVTTSFQKI